MKMNEFENKKCGIVSVIGAPNAGKSTLINQIVKEKVSIVSHVPQTTRHAIRAIYNDETGQIVFTDTPGMHAAKTTLNKIMNNYIKDSIEGADILLNVVDASVKPHASYKREVKNLLDSEIFIITCFNKIDLKHIFIDQYLEIWEKALGKKMTEATDQVISLPISGLKDTNTDGLLEIIFDHLTVQPALFPDNVLTDFPRQVAISDMVREKIIRLMRDELPHSIAVYVDSFEETEKNFKIGVKITVERQSQKKIVIGTNGINLKNARIRAQREIKKAYGKQTKLDIWVNVKKAWQANRQFLRQSGYIME